MGETGSNLIRCQNGHMFSKNGMVQYVRIVILRLRHRRRKRRASRRLIWKKHCSVRMSSLCAAGSSVYPVPDREKTTK